ncbi:MAG: PA14 domain-containing protein [bacterium]
MRFFSFKTMSTFVVALLFPLSMMVFAATSTSSVTTHTGKFLASFYDNTSLSGNPRFVDRYDSIDFDWGNGSPDSTVPADNFSARIEGDLVFDHDGKYVFTSTTDDGVRLKIDGKVVIDHWIAQPATSYSVSVALVKGTHSVVLEYLELGGGAVCKFTWAERPTINFIGDYFSNRDLAGSPVLTIPTDTVDYNWDNGSPDVSKLGKDNFSVRWTGTLTATVPGVYRFSSSSDDGSRLFIDKKLVLDRWSPQPLTTTEKLISLQTGDHEVVYEYNEWGGQAIAKLTWEKMDSEGKYVGEYFNNQGLRGAPKAIRLDSAIDFNWGLGTPFKEIGVDDFGVRWSGQITAPISSEYAFTYSTDDGIRVWVDDALVVDSWGVQAASEHTMKAMVSAGVHALRVEYFEDGGVAIARFSYKALTLPSTTVTLVPSKTPTRVPTAGKTPLPVSPSVTPKVGTPTAGGPAIRIGIYYADNNEPVRVTGTGDYAIQVDGKIIRSVTARHESGVTYTNGLYTVSVDDFKASYAQPIRFLPSTGTFLKITSYNDRNYKYGTSDYNDEVDNNNKFRGIVEAHYSTVTKAVWAVNELPMQQYLWGIGEVLDDFPLEYLKAFSIVTRSYALSHLNRGGKRKGQPFILVNNSGDQIYKGYNRERRQPNWVDSVNSTYGTVMTYEGGVITAPYFSSSDGRTRSYTEVWPDSELYWCLSKPDPYGTRFGIPKCVGKGCANHGVGMSANGAIGFAYKEGKTYDWILNYYFTGIKFEKRY